MAVKAETCALNRYDIAYSNAVSEGLQNAVPFQNTADIFAVVMQYVCFEYEVRNGRGGMGFYYYFIAPSRTEAVRIFRSQFPRVPNDGGRLLHCRDTQQTLFKL